MQRITYKIGELVHGKDGLKDGRWTDGRRTDDEGKEDGWARGAP